MEKQLAPTQAEYSGPKYSWLATNLRLRIEDGEWQADQPIPSERELEGLYRLSRTTIRQAIDVLVSQGYLYREHGRGTFVAKPKLQQSLHLLTSFSDEIRRQGFRPGQRVLDLGFIIPPVRVRQRLGLESETRPVFRVARLRTANDEPISISYAYLPLPSDQPISAGDLDRFGSLWALLEARYGLVPHEADETIEATIADEPSAALLSIREGSPLLMIERTTCSRDRLPMDYSRILYRADRYKYFVHMSQSNRDAGAQLTHLLTTSAGPSR